MTKKKLVVCVTGASGAVYSAVIIKKLLARDLNIHLIFSDCGRKIFEHELNQSVPEFLKSLKKVKSHIVIEDNNNMHSSLASGGDDFDVLICPCSMGTLGRIATGVSTSLIERVCDVVLKERKKLVCVIRESPLNLIHIKNMMTLTEAGALIMPASPFYYLAPANLDDLITQFSERVLKVFVDGYRPEKKWGGHDKM
jgi:4-hydroxy-3-polyprenylbenzoate decarboxylase